MRLHWQEAGLSRNKVSENDVEEFFRDKAYAYTKGQLRHVSLLFDVPCVFTVGTQTLNFNTHQDLEFALQTYREN